MFLAQPPPEAPNITRAGYSKLPPRKRPASCLYEPLLLADADADVSDDSISTETTGPPSRGERTGGLCDGSPTELVDSWPWLEPDSFVSMDMFDAVEAQHVSPSLKASRTGSPDARAMQEPETILGFEPAPLSLSPPPAAAPFSSHAIEPVVCAKALSQAPGVPSMPEQPRAVVMRCQPVIAAPLVYAMPLATTVVPIAQECINPMAVQLEVSLQTVLAMTGAPQTPPPTQVCRAVHATGRKANKLRRNGAERHSWTDQEDDVIRTIAAQEGGPSWRRIAAALPGRTDDAVRNRWKRLRELDGLDGAEEAGASADECKPATAENGVANCGHDLIKNKRMCTTSSGATGRSSGRGAERVSWTRSEDETIMSGVREFGHKWTKITANLPGRTDHAVRNRFHRLQTLLERPPK